MKTIKNRLNNFLETYEFYPNSVDFRIVSSRALEKFKNVQSFQLNEIRNGNYKFGESRRELLLLKFDLLTRVLIETENLCIQHYHNNITNDFIIDAAMSMLYKSRTLYEKIILEDHKDSFDDVFSAMWIEIVSTVEYVINERLRKLKGATLEVFYTEFVGIVSSSIQNSTFELFELDVQLSKSGHVDPMGVTVQGSEYIEDQITKCKGSFWSLDKPEIFGDTRKNERTDDRRSGCNCESLMLVLSNQTNTSNSYAQTHLRNKIDVYLKHFDIKYIFFKNLSDSPLNHEVIKLVESYSIPLDLRRSLIA